MLKKEHSKGQLALSIASGAPVADALKPARF
jgi:hypothetical protein